MWLPPALRQLEWTGCSLLCLRHKGAVSCWGGSPRPRRLGTPKLGSWRQKWAQAPARMSHACIRRCWGVKGASRALVVIATRRPLAQPPKPHIKRISSRLSDLRSGAARSKRELCLLVLIGTFSEEHGFNKTKPCTTRGLNGRVGGGRSPSHPHQPKCTPMSGTRPCLRRPPLATHEAKAATAAALPSPNRLPERP